MNSELPQTRLLFVRADVFRGGQAPRFWKRELFRQADRMATVLRSCVWLKQLAEVHPALFDQPLLGNCLTEVTSTGRQTSDLVETEARRGRRHLNRVAPVPKRVNRKMTEAERSRTSREKPEIETRPRSRWPATSHPSKPRGKGDKVLNLAPKADGSLLKRIAGAVVEVSNHHRVSLAQVSRLPVGHPHSSPAVVARSLRNQDWRNLVSFRAAKAWVADWPTLTRHAVTPPAMSNAPEQTNEVEGNVSPSLLTDQWVTPMTGPQASPEMLVRLASAVEPDAIRGATSMKRKTEESTAGSRPFTVRANSSDLKNPDVRPSSSVGGQREPFVRRFEAIFSEQDQRLHTSGIDQEPAVQRELTATIAQGELSAPPFVGSSLSKSMPPLLPAASPNAPVLPMATDNVRSGAWRDEVRAQEPDLELLAAQMKRILDEEARRHGIDI